MQTTTVFYIVIALLLSVLVAFFQYFYKVKSKPRIHLFLFTFKTLSVFLLFLLFINPTIQKTEFINNKPILSLLLDNSKSIPFFKEDKTSKDFYNQIKNHKGLNDKFNIQEFSFGNSLQVLDSLSYSENETNISKAISSVNKLYKEKIAPIVLLTDGNQTLGNDYEFLKSKQKIYPVVVGDTNKYKDLKISKLNVNKYSYIKNKFPVEVLLNYDGNQAISSKFSIFKSGKTVFTKNIQFSAFNKSITITANLESTKEGLNYYTASIRKIPEEKNTKNNTKSFSVEVIDEQTKVLILTSIIHPDIGALKKAIESNKQRSVSVVQINDFKNQINDYQLIILYQPNQKFNAIFEQIKKNNSNYFLVSGANTDFNFLNNQQIGFVKRSINKTENYEAVYNSGFLPFLQKNIGFNLFSPLKDKFGEVEFSKEYQTLLYKNINGIETQKPLLVSLEENNQKSAILFGEGIWKWRASSFLINNSFQDFDEFIGNFIQYLASNKKRSRLEVKAESLYPANSTINISAFYTDKNYNFDARAALEITITNANTNKVTKLPFSLVNNSYQTEIENLSSGNYKFKVSVIGQNIHKYGQFKITDYLIEEQFTNANDKKLKKLAVNSNGKLFYKNQLESLTQELLNDKTFYTTQTSIVKEQNLIDWKWILFLIISLLSVEWFVRKYHGKI